jgi:hypothetical protein
MSYHKHCSFLYPEFCCNQLRMKYNMFRSFQDREWRNQHDGGATGLDKQETVVRFVACSTLLFHTASTLALEATSILFNRQCEFFPPM